MPKGLLVALLFARLFLLGHCQDGGQQQSGGGLRFPNLFGGLNNPFSNLNNLFNRPSGNRQANQQKQPQQPPVAAPAQFPVIGGPLSPAAGGGVPAGGPPPAGNPNAFLQVPPPVVGLQPQGPQQQQSIPIFFQNPGSPVQQQFAQQPLGGQPIQQPPQQQHQQLLPQPIVSNSLNGLPATGGFIPSPGVVQQQPRPITISPQAPVILPIGNIPLQNEQLPEAQVFAPFDRVAPGLPNPPAVQQPPHQHFPGHQQLLPSQFALSGNSIVRQHSRQGKSIQLTPGRPISHSNDPNLVDCGAGNDLGFCSVSEKYPRHVVDDMMHKCHETVKLMYAEVPEDYDALGDGHRGGGQDVNSSRTVGVNGNRPWSWSTYKKESACESELRYIQPQVAKDRLGRWRIIVQTAEFPQRVAIDVCHRVDDVCKVFTDCGRKSRCVQRYSYQPLISLDQGQKQAGQCPTMAVFRFPTSCVCHVEVDNKAVTINAKNDNNGLVRRLASSNNK